MIEKINSTVQAKLVPSNNFTQKYLKPSNMHSRYDKPSNPTPKVSFLKNTVLRYALLCLLTLAVLVSCDTKTLDEGDSGYQVNPIIYELEEDTASHASGTKAKIYVMGSIHVGDKQYNFQGATEEKFQEADVLILEVDIDKAPDSNELVLLAEKNPFKAGTDYTNYEELINYYAKQEGYEDTFYQTYVEAVVRELNKELNMLNPSLPALDASEPAFLLQVIQGSLFENTSYRASLGVDRLFADKAKAQKKDMDFLEESIEGASASFNTDVDEQTINLVQAIATLGKIDNNVFYNAIDELVRLYVDQDIENIKEALKITDKNDSLNENLLSVRNNAWVNSLKNIIQNRLDGDKNTYFIVVGIAHLITFNDDIPSFQKLLDENGFTTPKNINN